MRAFVSKREKSEKEQEEERKRGGEKETSPLLSLRWDFYGWVSSLRAENT